MGDAADNQDLRKLCGMLTGLEHTCKELDTEKLRKIANLFKSDASIEAIAELLEVDLVCAIIKVTRS